MNFQPSKRAANGVGVIDHLFLKFRQLGILIGNSEPASSIDVFNRVTITAQLANQFGDALHGFSKRLRAGDLRADVHADSRYLEMPVACGSGIEPPPLLHR